MLNRVLARLIDRNRTGSKTGRRITVGLVSAVALPFIYGTPALGAPDQQIGITAAVKGDVSLTTPGSNRVRPAKSGDGVFFKERIQSGENSALQLMLLDETTFTLGANADIVIDEMVYDPATQDEGRLVVNVAGGVFRYISGDIAKRNPETVNINTPIVSVGIRGTSFFAVSNPDSGEWFFGLLGPGPNNNTGDAPGGIVVENEQGSTFIRRAGFGVAVAPGEGPGDPVTIPADVISQFQAAVGQAADPKAGGDQEPTAPKTAEGPLPEGGEKPEGELAGDFSAPHLAGQTTVESFKTVKFQKESDGLISQVKQSGDGETRVKAYSFAPLTYEKVRTFSGSGFYAKKGINMYKGSFPNGGLSADTIQEGLRSLQGDVVGKYDVALTVNFDTKSISGSYNAINVPTYSINNETVSISHTYSAPTGTFEKNKIQDIAGPYKLDTMITFVGGTGGPRPDLLNAISVQPDGTGNDLVIGGSILPAK